MYKVYKEHSERLPFVRIKRIELTNFKGVKHGVIDFNCAREFVPFDTKSDLLGLYGQNGSGKSSLVQAISAVKGLICGYKMKSDLARCIDVNSDYASICMEFDFQYPNDEPAMVSYGFKLGLAEKTEENLDNSLQEDQQQIAVRIFDEKIKTNLYEDGRVGRIHTIIDTSGNRLFCSGLLEKYYYDTMSESVKGELIYQKRKKYEDSYSFVFSEEVSDILSKNNAEYHCSKYYEILAELQMYADKFLFVIGTRTSGLAQIGFGIPIYMPPFAAPIVLNDKVVFGEQVKTHLEITIEMINLALETLIPDLQLSLTYFPTVTEKGRDGFYAKVMSVRDNRVFPFEYESDGIVKIVSVLADYIVAFNQGSTTLVVDEFDSGVFEYLLGEMLSIFESHGKGQLIFTSHNLRPLEVINKKFIRFTTSDPNNRYYRLRNIGSTNNLRDIYLREIQLNDLDVEMYRGTKSFKIVKALRRAGEGFLNYGEE